MYTCYIYFGVGTPVSENIDNRLGLKLEHYGLKEDSTGLAWCVGLLDCHMGSYNQENIDTCFQDFVIYQTLWHANTQGSYTFYYNKFRDFQGLSKPSFLKSSSLFISHCSNNWFVVFFNRLNSLCSGECPDQASLRFFLHLSITSFYAHVDINWYLFVYV